MDNNLARQYHKKLSELFSELQLAKSVEERAPVIIRMENIVNPLYVVHSEASQHISEALDKLKYPQQAIVNASHHTINQSLQQLFEAIESNPEEHFVLYGDDRVFAKPVAMLELESLREKGKLFDQGHNSFVHALDAPEDVRRVLLKIDSSMLKPVFSRLGFPDSEALVFFRTKALPSLGKPIESMPSLKICTLRSGIPVAVLQHRVL